MRAPLLFNHLSEPVAIPTDTGTLPGVLTLPPHPIGIVLFAHGSGSSRLSGRNRFVAQALVGANVGTLLFDLLTEGEARRSENVFDIPLLAERLRRATAWVAARPACAQLPIGYFGASTGAAAAIAAAAEWREPPIAAVVARGGRPDLAADALPLVRAPTLLIVGGADTEVLELNRWALARLTTVKRLVIVPGATHLFEEPGALEAVAERATSWFAERLPAESVRSVQ